MGNLKELQKQYFYKESDIDNKIAELENEKENIKREFINIIKKEKNNKNYIEFLLDQSWRNHYDSSQWVIVFNVTDDDIKKLKYEYEVYFNKNKEKYHIDYKNAFCDDLKLNHCKRTQDEKIIDLIIDYFGNDNCIFLEYNDYMI